jgi:hypothetical protein
MTTTKGQYDRAIVIELLPYLFENDLTGLSNPLEAAPDMPRGSHDPSHGNGWLVSLADLRTAWEEPILTEIERRRLLRFAFLGGSEGRIGRQGGLSMLAHWEGVTRQAVEVSVLNAAAKIADCANGLEGVDS